MRAGSAGRNGYHPPDQHHHYPSPGERSGGTRKKCGRYLRFLQPDSKVLHYGTCAHVTIFGVADYDGVRLLSRLRAWLSRMAEHKAKARQSRAPERLYG